MLDNALTRPPLARALSHIADNPPDLSDVLAPGRSACADPEHLGYAKSGCAEASQRLLLLHQAITDKLDVDSIRLDGRPSLFELIQPPIPESTILILGETAFAGGRHE